MKDEWNSRAHEGFRFVDDRAKSEAQFLALGEQDVACLLSDLAEPLLPEAKVLELGCGSGRLLGPMARRFREVWGVDISDEMLRSAAERLAHLPNIRLQANNGTDLGGLPSRYFDFCYSVYTFESIPERSIVESYLREAARVLVDGGIAKIQAGGIYPRNPYRAAFDRERDAWSGVRFTLAEFAGLAESAGFEVLAAYHPVPGGGGRPDWDEPLPQRRVWVIGRKGDGMDEWERVCWSIARTLRAQVAPGRRVITPYDRMRWYLGVGGADHVDLVSTPTPEDGADAVRLIESLRRPGPAYLLLSRYTSWWLDAYPELAAHLASGAREIVRTDDLRLFELPDADGP